MATVDETQCCGVMEMGSVGGSSKGEIVAALRTAKRSRAGMVYATTTQNQTNMHRPLREAGFKQVRRFKNPNTGNTIRFWMCATSSLKMPRRPRAPRRDGTSAYEMVEHAGIGFYAWTARPRLTGTQWGAWYNGDMTFGNWRWTDTDEDY